MAATLDTKQQFLELRSNGESYIAISKKIGISKTTLIKWSKELRIELDNLKAVAHEDLQKRYKLGNEYRIKLWSLQLDAIQAEIKLRGYKDVPTTKLITLMENISGRLEKEESVLRFQDNPHLVDSFVDMGKHTEYDTWQG